MTVDNSTRTEVATIAPIALYVWSCRVESLSLTKLLGFTESYRRSGSWWASGLLLAVLVSSGGAAYITSGPR